MLQPARDWLKRTWWGSLVAYALLVGASYLGIWAIIEPLNLPDTFREPLWPLNARWFYHIVAALLIGAHVTLAFDLWRRKSLWADGSPGSEPAGPARTGELDLLASRDQYLSAQLAAIQSSRAHVVLFTSKMHRSEEVEDARRVNAALSSAARRGIRPRVLVALADTRLPGALELSRSGTAVVRFDPTLHLSDANYLCVDESLAVLGERERQGDPTEYRSSRGWYRVRSRTLAASLMRHFDWRWWEYGTLTLEQMLRIGVPRNVRTHGVDHVAEAWGLSVESIKSYSSARPLIIFLAGRPGSGKTTVARTLVRQLSDAGLAASHTSDLEFLRRLFRGEFGSGGGFVTTPDGGYLVTDDGIWRLADDSLASAVSSLPSGIQIAILECARRSYRASLAQLASRGITPDFIAYISTPFDIALKRNIIRRDLDAGHYVSQAEMEASYKEDDFDGLRASLGTGAITVANEEAGGVELVAAEVWRSFRNVLDRRWWLQR